MIRLTVPNIDDSDVAAVEEVLRSGFLVQGERVQRFEKAVADYVGSKNAVAVSSCTAALYVSLIAAGIGPGDTVAVSAYSWPATANVVELCGAKPLFIDIDPETFNMSVTKLERVVTSERVSAVLLVHAFGGPADCEAVADIASNLGVPLIEDAACALGTRIGSRHAGTWGLTGCFSFHPRKTVTTGEGGVVVTDDARVADLCRALRNHGQDPNSSRPDFIMPGLNLRMTEMQGALGELQMRKLAAHVDHRRERAAYYDELIRDTDLQAPVTMTEGHHSYQSYVVLLPSQVARERERVLADLRSDGIETTIGTYNIPATAHYASRYGYAPQRYPVVHEIAERALTLPLNLEMTPEQQRYVVHQILRRIG